MTSIYINKKNNNNNKTNTQTNTKKKCPNLEMN